MAEIGMTPQPLRTPLQDVGNNLNAVRPGLTPLGNALQGQKPAARVAPTIIIDEKEIQRSRLALQQRTNSGLNIFNPKSQLPQGTKVRMPQVTYPEAKKLEGALRTGDREKNPSAGAPHQQPTATNPADINRRWLQMLPSCRFYFDNVDPTIVTKMSKVLTGHNSSVTMFFSSDVTHLITTRAIPRKEDHARIKLQALEESQNAAQQQASAPMLKPSLKLPGPPAPTQESSIIVKAIGFNIKIWHLERMKNLMEPLMGKSMAHTEGRKLQDLLLHEKTYGLTTTQKDDSIRSDYHIFKGPYVLIEDTTGRHRTILAHEYESKKPSSSGKCPWPKIQLHMTERSPFIHLEPRTPKQEAQAVPVKQDIEPSAAAGEAPRVTQVQDVQKTPSALASGIVNSVTSHVVSTTSAMGKAPHVQGPEAKHDEVLRQLGKRTLPVPKVDAVVSAPVAAVVPLQVSKKLEFARPAEIVRLGKGGTPLDAGTGPSRSEKAEPQAAPLVKPITSTADATVPTALELPAVLDPARQEQLKALAPAVPTEHRKKGYCENCRGFFDDMNRHIASQAHRIYAHDASKFEHLDKFLLHLKRQPKTVTDACTKRDDPDFKSARRAEGLSLEGSVKTDVTVAVIQPPIVSKGDSADTIEVGDNDPGKDLSALLPKDFTDTQESTPTINDAAPKTCVITETDSANNADCDKQLSSCYLGVAQEVPVISDNNDTNDTNDTNDMNDLKDIPTAETDILVTSTTCVESQDRLLVNPFLEDASEPARVPGLFPKRTFGSRLRLPVSDTPTSQADTDATQPDDRFLEGSAALSQSMEPVVSIHLALSMTSTFTDGPEPVPATSERERNFVHETEFLGSSDSDKEGCDDTVALVKSPCAGRGFFARSQGSILRSSHINLSGVHQDGELSRPAMSLKRKLDIAMSEDTEDQEDGTNLQTKVQSLKQKAIVYDDNLRSRLLSHAPPLNQSFRPAAWSSLRNPFESTTPPRASSPIQLLPETSPMSAQYGSAAPVDTTSDTLPLDSIGGRDLGRTYLGSMAEYGFDSQLGYPDTPSTQKVARMSAHQGTPITIPSTFVFNSHARQFASSGADFGFGQTVDLVGSGPASRQTSPTSPVGHESVLSRSPARSAYMESTSPSPSRSPSHRQMYRNHFPVMTRAEQEQERCFHHYRGHRLPEAAAQKKMRSSISLLEEFEEYGEGCMVFIE